LFTFDLINSALVASGIVTFILGGYAGESHSLANFWDVKENGEKIDVSEKIDGIDAVALEKYRREVLDKYWLGYKLMKDNRFGSECSMQIEESPTQIEGEIRFNLLDMKF